MATGRPSADLTRTLGRARRAVAERRERSRRARRLREIQRSPAAAHDTVRVYYGVDRIPARTEPAAGGFLKFQRLHGAFPNSPRDFNVLYLGSSSMPRDTRELVRAARGRRAAFVWNQNGVAYPAWHGPGWEQLNEVLAEPLHEADHVLYQSEFCRLSADRFLGPRSGPSEVLHNAVDTRVFFPQPRERSGRLRLLLAGSQRHFYRVRTALETVAHLAELGVDAELVVAGSLRWGLDPEATEATVRALVAQLGVEDRVAFHGPYTQAGAPELFRRTDVLLHTQYNDACPALVLEAMATGLAVVYSASGGVPELVGPDAGIGVPAPLDWETEHPPDPAELANAVIGVAERIDDYREAARRRAVERFDLVPWIERHRELFGEVLR